MHCIYTIKKVLKINGMSDKNNMNFHIINIEYHGKIINLIQIITFFHIYIKQTHLLR